ncbi:T9SS type A sorting domain-containing protein [candidate division TA06 bacterium]|uniref:T9SS type A sorting domain-containing protein n=1 Tax=candidate division TA06 bacterium TaxID=2250710 RepID=A0A523XPD4_UNCT6|nr:MAG: T9SS type A sorting domain-containing protein [candidate division TA06 bacterium]
MIDTLAYEALGSVGFWIVNVAAPAAPTVVDSFRTPGIAIDLFVRDTLCYVADYDSLQIISIARSGSLYRVGAVAVPSSCYDVFVVDTFAYVACQSSSGNDGSLQIVNVSDPSSPQIVASVDNIVGDPLDVWISGSYAYVAAADYSPVEGGVRVVDISDPLSPSLVASYDTPGDPRGVFAVGDLVFVADYDSLQILRHVAVGVEEKPAFGPRALRFRLAQNQPNPFSGFTVISYELATPGEITLEIYDVTGRLVRKLVDAAQPAGLHTAMWNGRDEASRKLASGVYFSRLTTESGTLFDKMLMVR